MKFINGLAGKIKVKVVARTETIDGKDTDGVWNPGERVIELKKGSLPPRQAKSMFWHEWMHSVLSDSGLEQVLTAQMNEALCDAVGNAMTTFEDGYR